METATAEFDLLAFVVHNACTSGDTIYFAETKEQFLEKFSKENENEYVIETWQQENDILTTKENSEHKKQTGKPKKEPYFLQIHNVTPDLVLRFGG